MRRATTGLVLVAAFGSVSFAAQEPPPQKAKTETVEESWNRWKWAVADAELQCRDRLSNDDPTVEWKRANVELKDKLFVVTAYGTRNMQMVTGVCHVSSKNDKRKVEKTWIK